jgi:branched-subunit amino acid aminotransferase/4-amino-4-deoxychorismate lyase
MSAGVLYRWRADSLEQLDYCDPAETDVLAADSWLVDDGRTLALDLHRDRFLEHAPGAESFWDAVVAALPREGRWFPRVELQRVRGADSLVYRERTAPEPSTSVVVATHPSDPRTSPGVKGPDLERMTAVRTLAQSRGAGEAVILSDGYVVEGAYSAILWWRGDILCGPPADFARVDSVTARSVLGLATALGVDTYEEAVTPAELDGCEVWALSALHGPRIVTQWVDGPQLAERPGRLRTWRARLDALRKPLP